MGNIHILPTDKPSRLHFDSKLFLSTNPQISRKINSIVEGRNIYITSDEEIREGDVFIFGFDNHILCMWDIDYKNGVTYEGAKKIILTTDQDLIKDYRIQAIDDDFLEWFVKNPSCEYVDQRLIWDAQKLTSIYQIIIPKEAREKAKATLFRYSEQEVLDILYKHTEDLLYGKKITLEEWFDNIKKK
jgi:hypothetical protein